MDTLFDLIIVGLGSHGSNCFSHFSGKMKVLGIEQYISPHTKGSHNGETRIVREMGYSGEYVDIARRSLELWKQLQDSTSEQVYVNSGGILFGDQSDNQFRNQIQQHNPNLQQLKSQEVESKFPIKTSQDQQFFYDKSAGFVRPELAISIFINQGRAKGGQVINNCRYINHIYKGDEIHVYTDLGVFKSKKLILSLGMGLKRLQNTYPLDINIYKQQVVFFKTDNKNFDKLPVFISENNSLEIYGFPRINGEVKIGLHHFGPSLEHPDLYDQTKNEQGSANLIRQFLIKYMPELKDAIVSRVETCVYTSTKDHNFTIDFDPRSKNTIILSACSGHGFKFCIVMGEILEEMFNTGVQKYKSFQLNRFQKPKF
ncbi:unnamed protein product [Paramecium primaurelia]|uniref:FAD dependent oxidoreductase domain-containing protein n=1 Tax=Paramecium primaurelia TaxID=5886 RepID=A0A8S1MFP4_PARPR|nr:unnamed protein product [Paramecium primaurelia]